MVHRLGEVLVGPRLEPGDDVLRFRHRGHQDDRRERGLLRLFQLAADRDAVELGHHDVEQDQVGLRFMGDREGLLAVAGGDDIVAVGGEAHAQDANIGRIVVGDQDPRRIPHSDS